MVCVIIYRPGSQSVNELFYEELTNLLETVVTYRCQILVCGDFNIRVNVAGHQHAQRLTELIESFDLVQSVVGSTHRAGNTLDLVLTRRDCCPSSCDVLPPTMSDHGLVVTSFPAAPCAAPRSDKIMRPWKKLNIDSFITSLRSSPLCANVNDLKQKSADELFRVYDGTLRRIVDEHVPAYTASVRDHRLSPWFDDDCRRSRRQSRMLERRYRRTLGADDRLRWVQQVRSMHALY